MQFIDSARFMASALSNALNNISEGMHKIKCKFRDDVKKCETCSIKYKYCNCFLEYTILNMIGKNTNVCVITEIIKTIINKSAYIFECIQIF